jgi:hypothetical protein
MKITEKRLLKLGYKEFVCEDEIIGYIKNGFVWINDLQFRRYECGVEYGAVICNEGYHINTIGRLNALYKAINGNSTVEVSQLSVMELFKKLNQA